MLPWSSEPGRIDRRREITTLPCDKYIKRGNKRVLSRVSHLVSL